MAESDNSTEFDWQRVLEFARNDQNGPDKRTARVYQHLVLSGKFTNWDVICFCAEYLASQVASLPWLEPPVRWLIRLIYMAHYIRFETISWMDRDRLSPSDQSPEKGSDGAPTTGPSQGSDSTS